MDDDVFQTDCGDFDLRDHFTFETHGKVFVDAAGNPVRIVEQVSGTETFYNSVTNESVTGTINAGEIVDLVDGTVTESGTVGRITVPAWASCSLTSENSSSTSMRAWSSWPAIIMPSSTRTTNFARCWANYQSAASG